MTAVRSGGVVAAFHALFRGGTTGDESDGRLLDHFLGDDPDRSARAFAALVDRHGPMVLGVCRRVLGRVHDAEDASQAAFLVLARRAGAIRRRELVGPWLHGVSLRIAKRARADALRRVDHERRKAAMTPPHRDDPTPGPDLDEALARLPRSLREAVVLCDLESLTHDQAAARLSVPVRTLQRRLKDGRDRLRDRLARSGLAPALCAAGWPPQVEPITPSWSDALASAAHAFAITSSANSAVSIAARAMAERTLRSLFMARIAAAVGLVVLAGTAAAITPIVLAQKPPPVVEQDKARAAPEAQSSLEGRVLDDSGKPIAGAGVLQGNSTATFGKAQARTDADGRFRLPAPAPGRILVTVQAKGFAPDMKALIFEPGSMPLEFRLSPGRTIRGRILDPDGKPLAGAMVVVAQWRGERTLNSDTRTDADGRFAIADAPLDAVLIQAAQPGFMHVPVHPVPESGEVGDLRLSRPLILSGRVLDDATGEPIDPFLLQLGDDPSQPHPRWEHNTARPHKDGRFSVTIDWPYPQIRGLRVQADGFLPAVSRPFKITEGVQTFDFRLKKGEDRPSLRPAIAGVLMQSDGPFPEGGVTMVLALPGKGISFNDGKLSVSDDQPAAVTSFNGRFQFAPQSQPATVFAASDRGFARASEADLAKSPRLKLVPWGRVDGVLRSSGKVMPHGLVRCQPEQSEGDFGIVDFSHRVRADAQGRFSFDRVVPGPARVYRSIELSTWTERSSSPLRIDIKPGETAHVDLGGGGRDVIGRVTPPEGSAKAAIDWTSVNADLREAQPPLNVPEGMTKAEHVAWFARVKDTPEVRAYDAWSKSHRDYSPKFAPDGSFRIEDVMPGTYDLTIPIEPPDRTGPRLGLARIKVVVPAPPADHPRHETLDIGAVEVKPGGR